MDSDRGLSASHDPKDCQTLAGGRAKRDPRNKATKQRAPRKGARTTGDKTMGSTFLSLHYHIVFSTKDRQPLIRVDWRPRLHEYLGGTVRGLDGIPEVIGGVQD